ncbi:hypothetical protein DK842_12130 [Chromobacterium phragmitis]|uniref:phospholipase effector Tle1 domain-containing protein n=1 Tax=Chromobacterium phragmitis TaxID=2202141 RepID=UPI000DECFCDC|nr:DUF2235 domain-containing protein [Chromobacterium phragmitis]AXE30585.1 hypothetical protein DK842_12130 [Chromobacterium phragmitis]
MSSQNASTPQESHSISQKAAQFQTKGQLTGDTGKIQPSCKRDVWAAFFFDGTNNNRDRDLVESVKKGKPRYLCEHSNIVTLYESTRADNENYHFTYYMQGVGTVFKEIGEDEPNDKGLSLAQGGQSRLSYAYYQLCNAIHVSLQKTPLFKGGDFKKELSVSSNNNPNSPDFNCLQAVQQKLAAAIGLNKNTPKIQIINVAVFGFSRGAAEARVFCRWLEKSCKQDGDTWLFAGCVPIRLQFLGIFDTVASVGLAHSTPTAGREPGRSASGVIDGQMGWATPDMLKVTSFTKNCRHYVAAHEVRYSFPLTSIRHEDGGMPSGAIEVVYPGSHSDVGGGYGPGDQGKAAGHRRKLLSQIPLLNMYRDAKNLGVPLYDLKTLEIKFPDVFKDYSCDPILIKRFSSYMKWAGSGGSLVEEKLYHHLKKYWYWRVATSPQFMQQDCMQQLSKGTTQRSPRADKQDLEDMRASEQDWLGDLNGSQDGETGEAADLLKLRLQAGKLSVPKDVHDFLDQHVHDSHASFYMIGPTTAWQRQQRVANIRSKLKRPTISASGLNNQGLSPFEQKAMSSAPGDATDPAKIDASNFPVVSDKDYADLVKSDGFAGTVAGAMTNTRREVGGHGHQRATFVGSQARYAKTKERAVDVLAKDTLRRRQDQLAEDYSQQVKKSNIAYENQKAFLKNQGLPSNQLDRLHQQDLKAIGIKFKEQMSRLNTP